MQKMSSAPRNERRARRRNEPEDPPATITDCTRELWRLGARKETDRANFPRWNRPDQMLCSKVVSVLAPNYPRLSTSA